MASPYDKNYTANGSYLLNYKKPEKLTVFKNQVLQFRIELLEIEPLIWRRIQVPSGCNFWDLHVAIQDAMGWNDTHLHHFEIRGKNQQKQVRIGIPDFERDFPLPEIFPGWEIPVSQYFNALGVAAEYLYDYGDSWRHFVQLEGYLLKDTKRKYPLCIEGERACPPDDCGGSGGYYNLLEVLADPENDEYEDIRRWVGKKWHPETFKAKNVTFDNPYQRWKNAFVST